MGATYLAVAPQHPVAKAAAVNNPELAAFVEAQSNIKVAEAEMATMEKLGMATGQFATPPAYRKASADLGRQFRIDELRLRCRDVSARPRRARSRLCQQIWSAHRAGRRQSR